MKDAVLVSFLVTVTKSSGKGDLGEEGLCFPSQFKSSTAGKSRQMDLEVAAHFEHTLKKQREMNEC